VGEGGKESSDWETTNICLRSYPPLPPPRHHGDLGILPAPACAKSRALLRFAVSRKKFSLSSSFELSLSASCRINLPPPLRAASALRARWAGRSPNHSRDRTRVRLSENSASSPIKWSRSVAEGPPSRYLVSGVSRLPGRKKPSEGMTEERERRGRKRPNGKQRDHRSPINLKIHFEDSAVN